MRISPRKPLRIGTRGSLLALAQAREVRDRVGRAWGIPESCFEIRTYRTSGDRLANRRFQEIGQKGIFCREIEEGLFAGEVDIAVHSMKDMPIEQPEGLVIDAVLPREDPRDGLISREFRSLSDLPDGSLVGTSSTRRRAQASWHNPRLRFVEFRGNLDTRLRKLLDGQVHCTFLAVAGLRRMSVSHDLYFAIPCDCMLPAPAQGAICIECRSADARLREFIRAVNDPDTEVATRSERALLKGLGGSCEMPIGALATFTEDGLYLAGEVLTPDGTRRCRQEIEGRRDQAAELGRELANELRHAAGSWLQTIFRR